MELVIGKEIQAPANPMDAYVISVEAMHGDADGFQWVELPWIYKKEEAIAKAILVRAIVDTYTKRRSRVEFKDALQDLTEGNWPYDHQTDYNYACAPYDYKIRYYDGLGREFEVELK